VIPGTLFELNPNFTPVKIYRKGINVSEINPFPNLPERIGGLGGMVYDLWWIWHPAARMPFMQAGRNLPDENPPRHRSRMIARPDTYIRMTTS